MKKLVTALAVSLLCLSSVFSQNYIADHTVATDSVLRTIPHDVIAQVRNNFHIVYQHTSHGTHVARGMFGLPGFKPGDDTLFAITKSGEPEANVLNFRDSYVTRYGDCLHAYGTQCPDLSRDETAFVRQTREFLDDPDNDAVNIVMWGWCNIANHDVVGNYLAGVDSLMAEYGPGGTNPRAANNPIQFIVHTGHANTGANVGDGRPKNQADLIRAHCEEKGYFCLDYYNIDAHDMAGNYWEDAGDNGNSSDYGGGFYQDWQDSHEEGVHWYRNLAEPGGTESLGAHTTQHITSNRKAFAMWWILARLTGWDGNGSTSVTSTNTQAAAKKMQITTKGSHLQFPALTTQTSLVFTDLRGRQIYKTSVAPGTTSLTLNVGKGVYLMQLSNKDISLNSRICLK